MAVQIHLMLFRFKCVLGPTQSFYSVEMCISQPCAKLQQFLIWCLSLLTGKTTLVISATRAQHIGLFVFMPQLCMPSQVCPSWEYMALKYQAECTSHLRTWLLHAEVLEYPDIISEILCLCICEIMSGNLSAAKAHCNILRPLFEVCANKGSVDAMKLLVSLNFDRTISVISKTRTSFDVEAWVPQIIVRTFDAPISQFPHLLNRPTTPLDKSINRDEPVMGMVSELRDLYHTIILTSHLWSQTQPPSELITFLRFRLTWLESRIVNGYIDLIESGKNPDEMWSQAYICLAVFMSHTIIHTPSINGILLNDKTSNIKESLQKAIVNSETTSNIAIKGRYSNALLWTLFVSASAERREVTGTNNGKPWFETRFRTQLLSMGLTNWTDIHKIVVGFPCAPEILTQDLTWVEELMNTVYETHGQVCTDPLAFRAYDGPSGGFK